MSDEPNRVSMKLSIDELDQLDQICDRFEDAWRRGAGPESSNSSVSGPARTAARCSTICWLRRSTPAGGTVNGPWPMNTASDFPTTTR